MASTNSSHEYIAPGPTDSRSPCPALNALANHGYLPRDGKNLTLWQLVGNLRSVYGVSFPLAFTLSSGALAMLGHGMKLDLEALRTHNSIEHDASMAHRDIDETGTTIADNHPDPKLIQDIIDLSDGETVTLENLVQTKFIREERAKIHSGAQYAGKLLSIFSRGEPPLLVSVMGDGKSISVERLKTFLGEERIPDGYKPQQTTGAFGIDPVATQLGNEVDALHAAKADERRTE